MKIACIALAFLLSFAGEVRACKPADLPVDARFSESTHVFLATVKNVRRICFREFSYSEIPCEYALRINGKRDDNRVDINTPNIWEAKLRLVQVFKGKKPPLKVRFGQSSCTPGSFSEKGNSLVFVGERDHNHYLAIFISSQSEEYKGALELVRKLSQ